jgi:RNA polymerase-interacting CarD/CdnL/TRCF family regulator
VKLAVGDVVVYGPYGVGRVSAREERLVLGAAQDVVVVELHDGLTVTFPLERARTQLRPLATDAVLRRVRDALRAELTLSVDPWLSRRKVTVEKMAGGDLVELAEIVRESAQRGRIRSAKGGSQKLSFGEREVFLKARNLLSDEIALVLGLQPAAADDWIEEQLACPR